ncbi:alpha/beta-hydrolase [Thozetella sp. PMI_491]|nr:alpha/beta-hydrolase [Thozetella sp. PMI_491]
MTPRKVTFLSSGMKVVGDLYLPTDAAPDRKRAALAVVHPFTGVKEQTAGLHARLLAEKGFITLAFDAAYQGESEGEPRGLEDPYQRSEDLRSAVSYLSLLPEVDPERIGTLGICAGGGYSAFTAASDLRIKALATVSLVDCGRVTREGIRIQTINSATLTGLLTQTGQDRIQEMKQGGNPAMVDFLPSNEPSDTADGASNDFHEGTDYYRTPRAQHPRSTGFFPRRCYDVFATFDPFAFVHMISPRPLLMIAGSKADTRIFSEDGIRRAREPKELFIVPGRTHIELYDHVDGHLEKLVTFFAESLTV